METDTDNSVLEVLKNLPVMYRNVFLLKYSSRLENKEIARMLRISEENVRKRIEQGGRLWCRICWTDWRKREMGRINVTDEWLYQHMPLVNEEMIRELEEQTDDGYQFSRQFEDNMKKIIRKEKRMGRRKRLNAWAAAAAACIAVFLSAAAVNVYGDKIKFFGTVKSLWENSLIYSYFTEDEPDGLKVRKPGYVPLGYKLLSEDINASTASFLYQNAAGR